MFSQSGTSTPVPSSASSQNKNVIPIHDQINDSITWVYDWYSPNFNNPFSNNMTNGNYNIDTNNGSTINDSTTANTTNIQNDNLQNFNSLKLKGWFKTNFNHKSNTFKQQILTNDSYLNLNSNKWKYLKDSSITPPIDEDIVIKEQTVEPVGEGEGQVESENVKLDIKGEIPESNKQYQSAI
ncbi:hypothetical protein KGF54_004701 [Candida jiufengensis]|uniref:uncharacterized protein n=1 Tax=Candida jiufengensis TaxID=497108 RepID=UPI002225A541|nr:uncharacterized protein KGF54_004701 [Candida jiufengensis]KAI5951627.1 hypothetical protein KGF54_004701 [Candida jiufengensis]